MIVNFYATLRQVVGIRQVEFSLNPGSTLRDLIDEILKRYPDLRTEIIDPQGNVYQHIHFFINGRDSTLLDGKMDTILQADDIISIFPPVGGG